MTDRTIDTLGDAFREYRTPFENQRFIADFVARVDAAALLRYSDHFRVERRSGEPALQVHHGSTIGFRSEDEVREVVGDVKPFPSEWLPGCWGVRHPVSAHSGGGERSGSPRQVANEPCPRCGEVMSLAGCDWCGWKP